MKLVKVVFPLVVSLILIAVALVAMPAVAEPAGTASDPLMVEYPLPGAPQNIVVESPGRVWFTLPLSNAIGSLVVTSTLDYEVTIYQAPTNNSEPYDLAYDGSAIWFTEQAGNKLGRLSLATKVITETSAISTTNVTPAGVAVASDGKVWFTEQSSNKLGLWEPGIGFTEYAYTATTTSGAFDDIVVRNDGVVWFTAPGLDMALQFDLNQSSDRRFSPYPTGGFSGSTWPPGGIALDSSGYPWVTAPQKDWIGRYAPGTLAFWNWLALPTSGGDPARVTYRNVSGNHYLWYTEPTTGLVGQFVADSQISMIFSQERPLPTPNSLPSGIAVDANGHVWIAESGSNKIAEWIPPYFHFIYLPSISKP